MKNTKENNLPDTPLGAASDGIRGNRPDLSGFTVWQLAAELHRRRGECVALILTPEDVCQWWECDESGATSPDARMPSEEAWASMCLAFERWQDCGAYGDAQTAMREAWIASDPESFSQKEGGCL